MQRVAWFANGVLGLGEMAPGTTKRKPARATAVRKQVLTDLRRGEIIDAALKVFARKGFHGSRAEDVATQAKIAKGTLYLYFASKDAIYDAALQHACEGLDALSGERVAAAAGVEAKVQAWVQARLEFWGGRGDMYHMILTVGREIKHRKQTAAIIRASRLDFTAILGQAIAAGELPERDLDAIGWLVMDAIRGSNERKILHLCEQSIAKETAMIVGTVMRYFQ